MAKKKRKRMKPVPQTFKGKAPTPIPKKEGGKKITRRKMLTTLGTLGVIAGTSGWYFTRNTKPKINPSLSPFVQEQIGNNEYYWQEATATYFEQHADHRTIAELRGKTRLEQACRISQVVDDRITYEQAKEYYKWRADTLLSQSKGYDFNRIEDRSQALLNQYFATLKAGWFGGLGEPLKQIFDRNPKVGLVANPIADGFSICSSGTNDMCFTGDSLGWEIHPAIMLRHVFPCLSMLGKKLFFDGANVPIKNKDDNRSLEARVKESSNLSEQDYFIKPSGPMCNKRLLETGLFMSPLKDENRYLSLLFGLRAEYHLFSSKTKSKESRVLARKDLETALYLSPLNWNSVMNYITMLANNNAFVMYNNVMQHILWLGADRVHFNKPLQDLFDYTQRMKMAHRQGKEFTEKWNPFGFEAQENYQGRRNTGTNIEEFNRQTQERMNNFLNVPANRDFQTAPNNNIPSFSGNFGGRQNKAPTGSNIPKPPN